MITSNIKAIIFDIDGTLHADISWLKLTEGLGASVEKHMEIFDNYLENKISYKIAKVSLIKLWQKTGNANKKYMADMFASWNLKPDAHATIDYLKNKYKVILISGSVDLYVQVVANKLGVKDWRANTTLDWDVKGNLTNFHYIRNQAAKKVNQFIKIKKSMKLKNDNFAVIGDGDSDVALFEKIKCSVMVEKEKAHPELEVLAYKKVNDLSDLKSMF